MGKKQMQQTIWKELKKWVISYEAKIRKTSTF